MNESNFYKLHLCLAIFFIACLSGVAIRISPFNSKYLYFGSFISWFFLSIYLKRDFLRVLIRSKHYLGLFFLIFSVLGSFYSYGSLQLFDKNFMSIYAVSIVCIYYLTYGSRYEQAAIFYSAFSVVLFSCLFSLLLLIKEPMSFRDSFTAYTSFNKDIIGVYPFINNIFPLALLIISILFKNLTIYTGYYLLFVLMVLYIVVKSTFTTVLLISLISFSLLLFINLSLKSQKKTTLFIISLIIIAVFFYSNISSFLIELGNILAGKELSVRLLTISDFLQTGNIQTGSSLHQRLVYSHLSIDTFCNNPFFGMWGRMEKFQGANIGWHAEWFDDLGLFGLFGVFLFISFFVNYFINIFQLNYANYYKRGIFSVIFYYLLLGLFENTTKNNAFGIVIFIFIPFLPAAFSFFTPNIFSNIQLNNQINRK